MRSMTLAFILLMMGSSTAFAQWSPIESGKSLTFRYGSRL